MTYFQAALQVLKQSREPLTAGEILERTVGHGLVTPTGKTPEASLRATLYRHLGTHPELVRVAQPGRRAQRATVKWSATAKP